MDSPCARSHVDQETPGSLQPPPPPTPAEGGARLCTSSNFGHGQRRPNPQGGTAALPAMAAPTMLTAPRTWKISHREHNRQMHAAHGNTAPRHNVAGALRRYNAAGSHGAPPPDGEQRHQQRQTPRQRPRRPRHHHHADEGAGEHPPLVIATSATWAARLRRQAAANGAAPRQGQVPRPRRQPRARELHYKSLDTERRAFQGHPPPNHRHVKIGLLKLC